jgi:ribosome-binding protein aMBF1 (putative translation factor)
MAGLEALWELTGEGKEKGKERRGRGGRRGPGGAARGAPMEVAARGGHGGGLSVCSSCVHLFLREKGNRERKEKQRRKKERRKRKRRKRKKRKKYGKFSKLKNF